MQAREFLFLCSQFFNHALHRRSHECRSVFRVGIRAGPIATLNARTIVQHFAHQVEERHYAEQKQHEQRCGVPEVEREGTGDCRTFGKKREYEENMHFYRTISSD